MNVTFLEILLLLLVYLTPHPSLPIIIVLQMHRIRREWLLMIRHLQSHLLMKMQMQMLFLPIHRFLLHLLFHLLFLLFLPLDVRIHLGWVALWDLLMRMSYSIAMQPEIPLLIQFQCHLFQLPLQILFRCHHHIMHSLHLLLSILTVRMSSY
jgi:hypothetical protein